MSGTVASAATTDASDFRVVGEDRYFMSVHGGKLEFDFDHVRRDRGELVGELHVRTTVKGARTFQGVLSAGTFNVSSTSARQSRAKLCEAAARKKLPEIDFPSIFEEFAVRVLEADRAGGPAIDLRHLSFPDADDHHDVDGLVLPKRLPSMIYAQGGAGKTITSEYIAGRLAAAGERPCIFDWEFDQAAHASIQRRLFGHVRPPVLYVDCKRRIAYEADRLKRLVTDNRVTYAVLDSVAFACGGKPEDAEVTLEYFRVLRQLGIGTLNLAHVPKTAETGAETPFGSQFWFNGVRSLWFAASHRAAADRLVVGFYHRKNNLGPLHAAIGLELIFDAEAGRIHVSPCNVSGIRELAPNLPIWQRMKTALDSSGPQTLAALAKELNVSVETLDRTVRRKNGFFTRVSGDDHITKIALHQGWKAS